MSKSQVKKRWAKNLKKHDFFIHQKSKNLHILHHSGCREKKSNQNPSTNKTSAGVNYRIWKTFVLYELKRSKFHSSISFSPIELMKTEIHFWAFCWKMDTKESNFSVGGHLQWGLQKIKLFVSSNWTAPVKMVPD